MIIGIVQYYRDMWPRRSHTLSPLIEAYCGPKGRKIIWDYALEYSFKEIKVTVSYENLLSCLYCTISFTVRNDASDKNLGAVISQNNKPIAFFPIILINPQRNYTTT